MPTMSSVAIEVVYLDEAYLIVQDGASSRVGWGQTGLRDFAFV